MKCIIIKLFVSCSIHQTLCDIEMEILNGTGASTHLFKYLNTCVSYTICMYFLGLYCEHGWMVLLNNLCIICIHDDSVYFSAAVYVFGNIS